MRSFSMILTGVCLFTLSISAQDQIAEMRKLVVLESTRDEVEKILGKPEKYFETYGLYRTESGKFSVDYSKGGCHKGVEGRQWNVPVGRMTSFSVYPEKSLPLTHYVSEIADFEKSDSPFRDGKYWYISADGSVRYETIMAKDSAEFVYSISIEPSKEKDKLLCKDRDAVGVYSGKQSERSGNFFLRRR